MGTTRRICFDVNMSPVTRRALSAYVAALFATPLLAQVSDPFFSQVSFDGWRSQKSESHLRWSARVGDPRLSTFQRLVVSVQADVDGAEITKRRGKGHLIALVEVRDSKGIAWQNHQEFDLTNVAEGIKANTVEFGQLMFVLPGDYRISIAIYDDATGEHSLLRRQLHVSALRNDPFTDAWRGLPAVEFLPTDSVPPETWYFPSVEGKLNLAVSTREPVQVQLVVNLTPSGQLAASTGAQKRALEMLIPAAKVISEVNWGATPFGIAFLDMPKQRVVYQQDDERDIDWSKAADALAEVNAGTIDAKALEKRRLSANFFVGEVRWEISHSRAKGLPVVIILSGAIRFNEDQELIPIRRDSYADPKVYYIRYRPIQRVIGTFRGRTFRTEYLFADQLEPLLKPLEPRLFEVSTQEQVRRAIAEILSEISKL